MGELFQVELFGLKSLSQLEDYQLVVAEKEIFDFLELLDFLFGPSLIRRDPTAPTQTKGSAKGQEAEKNEKKG